MGSFSPLILHNYDIDIRSRIEELMAALQSTKTKRSKHFQSAAGDCDRDGNGVGDGDWDGGLP